MNARMGVLNTFLGVVGLLAVNAFNLGLGLTLLNLAVTIALGLPGLGLLLGVRWLF